MCSGLQTALAQSGATTTGAGVPAQEVVIERGPHHRVIETTRVGVDRDDRESTRHGRYTELRNGMHYQMDGEWIESEEVIEAYPGGAAALRGPHRVVFPTDLTATEGVDLLTPDSKRLRFRVLGLAWVDADTGTQRWLARTRSCVGVIVPPNQVVWEDAFDEVWADVRYTYTSGALEQDIILREPIR
ncbi:MAG: hypothetical protein ACYDC1_21835, partial [Limisphaerales bacterium]